MNKQYFVLAHAVARQNALKAIQNAPDGYTVMVDEPKRNGEQNAKLHAALTELGRRIDWKFNGVKVDVDGLKIIFMSAYRRMQKIESRFVIGIDGHPVDLGVKTSKLTKKECIEFIEMIEAYLNGGDV